VSSVIILISPQSRGSVTLNSTSPFQNPIIDTQFLSTSWDINTMVTSVKNTRALFTAQALQKITIGPFGAWSNATTDDEIVAYLRANVGTLWHPTSTASIARNGSTSGVVNSVFQVRQTTNLRVVDSSIFPYVTPGHPMGMLYAITERAADMIKRHHGK